MLSKYEKQVQLAKKGDIFEYHKGYLARDRHFNNDVRDIGNFFYRLAEMDKVELYQKRLKHGSANHDPVFQYVARKI